jgi:hypothetical protein
MAEIGVERGLDRRAAHQHGGAQFAETGPPLPEGRRPVAQERGAPSVEIRAGDWPGSGPGEFAGAVFIAPSGSYNGTLIRPCRLTHPGDALAGTLPLWHGSPVSHLPGGPREASMKDDTGNRVRSGEPESETLSGLAILAILALLALVLTGGYFFLLKMIDISKQEDCILANRHNCEPNKPFRQ